jgi:hypothetical protein
MTVLFGEPQHGVLHDIERCLLFAYGEDRLLESAPLDALQKRRKLATRCQLTLCRGGVVRADVTIMVSKVFPPVMDRVKTSALSGAEIVIRCLQEEAVEYVFGYPGGAVLFIYDELFKQDKVKHVLVRHEQGAAHAADGYSRSSHKVGVCLVTSGPGLTNAVTGIATAYMDSIPMVVLTGQVPTHAIGQDAFQEVDTVGITRPCVKHNFLVKDVKDLALTIKKAFYIAATGRPGPVFQLWQNVVVPAGGSAILTQTQNGNFNTSASPIAGCGLPLAADEARIPKITITVAGTSTDYADSTHVLDTGGFDSSCRGNQSLEWRPVGMAGMESAAGSIQLISDGAPHAVGTQDTVTVEVNDAGNQPLANAPVKLNVLNGPNAGKSFTGVTDSTGVAVIQYSSTAQGNDLIQAVVNNVSGGALPSLVEAMRRGGSGWPSAILTRMGGSSGRSTRCHSSTMPVRQSRKSTGIATAPACQRQSIRQAQRGTTEAICNLPRIMSADRWRHRA